MWLDKGLKPDFIPKITTSLDQYSLYAVEKTYFTVNIIQQEKNYDFEEP